MSRELDIRVVALRDAIEGEDPEFRLRGIHRWYSRTFATPLHLVASLPEDDVLRHYYEARYEELVAAASGEDEGARLAKDDLAREREILAMTPQEYVEARREEEAEEARVQAMLERDATQEGSEGPPAGAEPALPDSLAEAIRNLPDVMTMEFPLDLDADALGGPFQR